MKQSKLEIKIYLLLCLVGFILGLIILFCTSLSLEWCGAISTTFVLFSAWILLRIEEKYFNNKHISIQKAANAMTEQEAELFVIKLLACSTVALLIITKLTYITSFSICLTVGLIMLLIHRFISYIIRVRRNKQ
ncbi:MAG: hypothetical protein DBY24_11840 [Prevotellaceae bacterium]|nr:MAG: hypothetical protein DBY24_11840 [Prevotellaceae bacterium]